VLAREPELMREFADAGRSATLETILEVQVGRTLNALAQVVAGRRAATASRGSNTRLQAHAIRGGVGRPTAGDLDSRPPTKRTFRDESPTSPPGRKVRREGRGGSATHPPRQSLEGRDSRSPNLRECESGP
jgi:hypothetical protein